MQGYCIIEPLKLENETTYQAYKSDIDVRNNDELQKINKQLEQINIKLDKMSMSLIDYISNLIQTIIFEPIK